MQLSSVDEELRTVHGELDSAPGELTTADDSEQELARRLADVQVVCAAEEKRCRACEVDLTTIEKRMSRAESRLGNLISADQVSATEREMAALREQIGDLEEQALLSMDRVESLQGDRDRIAAELKELRSELACKHEQWDDRSPKLRQRGEELQGFREQLQGELNGEQRRLYSTALGRGSHGASPPAGITLVNGFICSTCHKRLPPMWVNESRVWQRLYCCDGCKRILVFDPDDAVS